MSEEKKKVSEWEELWGREIPESELDRLVNTDWLREVKAVGDATEELLEAVKGHMKKWPLTPLPKAKRWRRELSEILTGKKCPACGGFASQSPCMHCGNDIGMEYGLR